MRKKFLGWLFCVSFAGLLVSPCSGQVREVRRFMPGQAGYTSLDRFGNPVVAINPIRCRLMGPRMCAFVRAHEYAHVYLGHLNGNIDRRVAEAEADRWAAAHVSPQVAQRAVRWFRTGRGASSIHGSGMQRANRVVMASAGSYGFQPIPSAGRGPCRSSVRYSFGRCSRRW